MQKSDNLLFKIIIGFVLFMSGPFGLIIYYLGKRSKSE